MNEADRQIFSRLDGQHKALFALLKKHINKKFDELITTQASLEAFIITITSDETFQKIIKENLEKATREREE